MTGHGLGYPTAMVYKPIGWLVIERLLHSYTVNVYEIVNKYIIEGGQKRCLLIRGDYTIKIIGMLKVLLTPTFSNIYLVPYTSKEVKTMAKKSKN